MMVRSKGDREVYIYIKSAYWRWSIHIHGSCSDMGKLMRKETSFAMVKRLRGHFENQSQCTLVQIEPKSILGSGGNTRGSGEHVC